MTLAELGRKAGLDRTYVSACERGRFCPPWRIAVRLVRVLGVGLLG